MNTNYQNKVLLTGIMLLSLFVITLNNQSFNNTQLGVFILILVVLYCLPMVINMEGFTDYKGSYSGYKYQTKCDSDKWRKEPCNVPLNDTMGFTPHGSSVPPNSNSQLESEEHSNYPSVDGVSDKNSMFMFSYNKASPDCCPSTFSTSTGCVCTTPEQRTYVNSRGGNNSTNSNF